ncbi:MAG: SpoIID/LytB domain-containing protein [Gemmatimonadetes bacterium]|nr:SpoIID/LytB domain-containing protein [Gemmatimonadota bacterium]
MRARFALLALVFAACRPAAPERPARGLPTKEPTVRIGVRVAEPEIVIGATSSLEITEPGGDRVARSSARERWTFTADEAGHLRGRSDRGGRIGERNGVLLVRADEDGDVSVGERRYRGSLLVRAAGPGRVTAVNVLELEEYLLGVVPLEIGRRTAAEFEAVKAQAIAARTYTVGGLGSREALGFDLYASTADQVYEGVDAENELAARAVRETRGVVLLHEGRPILAYYHSTCGGRTAAIEQAWPWRASLPYLRSVSDRVGASGRAYCDGSNRYRWEVTWTGDRLLQVLARTLVAHAGAHAAPKRIESVKAERDGASGRVRELRIVADGETYRVRADSLRWVLRPEPERILNSTLLFEVEQNRAGGAVRRLIVRGGGWGHGVGMCQMGAIGRARAGQDHRRILKAYYRHVQVARIY